MNALAWLIPAALVLSLFGLVAFMWALRSGQFDDLEGAAYRILEDDYDDFGSSQKDKAEVKKESTEAFGEKDDSAQGNVAEKNDETPPARGA
jgi:cbb3-type cytochrome oxidase maturation protein